MSDTTQDNGWLGDAASVAASIGGKVLAGAAAGSVVPGVGTVLGGVAALASAVVPYVFGTATKPALQAAAQALTGAVDEAQQVQMLQADPNAMLAFRQQALEIAQQELEAQNADTADARDMQQKLVDSKSKIAWEGVIIDVWTLTMFSVITLYVLRYGLPHDQFAHDLLTGLIGVLTAQTVVIVQYWRGSSRGSAVYGDKIQTLAMRK